jgi:hypothetical protein
MARLILTDERWSKLRGIMLQHRIYDMLTLGLITGVARSIHSLESKYHCQAAVFRKRDYLLYFLNTNVN